MKHEQLFTQQAQVKNRLIQALKRIVVHDLSILFITSPGQQRSVVKTTRKVLDERNPPSVRHRRPMNNSRRSWGLEGDKIWVWQHRRGELAPREGVALCRPGTVTERGDGGTKTEESVFVWASGWQEACFKPVSMATNRSWLKGVRGERGWRWLGGAMHQTHGRNINGPALPSHQKHNILWRSHTNTQRRTKKLQQTATKLTSIFLFCGLTKMCLLQF